MFFLSSLPRTLKAGVATALFALCLGAPWRVATAQPAADAAIQATVTAWTQAWSAKDVERYLAFYAPAFKPSDGQSRKAWEKQRRARVTAPQFIEVSASDIKVLRHDDARAAASFRQRYRSNLFQDEANKTLELVRDGERWLIAEERVDFVTAGAAAAPAPTPAADAGISTALGTLRVLSALGQPLRAEVAVGLAQRGEQGILSARLASPETYGRAGIEFNAALLGVSVSIQRRDGKPVIEVTTPHAVNEPFLRLLIELESRSGRLVRDYTALLDPPREAPPPPAAAPVAAAPPPPPAAPAAPAAIPAAPTKAPAAMAPPTRVAEGRIRTPTAAPATSKPRVKPPGDAASRPGAAASDEDRLAHARAMKETESRIEELEKKAAELVRLIETRNRQIAELEKRAADARLAPVVAPTAKPAIEAPRPAIEAPKPAIEAPKPVAEAPKPATAPKPAAVAPKPAPEAKPAAKPRPAPPPPAPAPSLVDEYLGDPVMLGGLGVVFLLLVGYGAYAWRKKKAAARSRLDDELPAMGVAGAAAVGAAAGDEARGAAVTQAKAEDVDALAEADVYMAYGRDAQAEEILREALQKGEKRPAVHLKLLQIYAKRQDTEQFEAEARKLYGIVNGAGPEWDKAMALGRSIDPSNALYGQGESLDSEAGTGAPEAPAVDFDLNAIMGPGQAQAAEPEAKQAQVSSILDFDLGGSTGEVPVVAPPAATAPAPSALDLSTISLNLEEIEPASASASAGGGMVSRQEVAIKIDVAKAYIEIGDKDGARELLNEVLREGSAAQQSEARQILESLE